MKLLLPCRETKAWRLSRHDFDVILTDLHLPDISGIGLIKSAREVALRPRSL